MSGEPTTAQVQQLKAAGWPVDKSGHLMDWYMGDSGVHVQVESVGDEGDEHIMYAVHDADHDCIGHFHEVAYARLFAVALVMMGDKPLPDELGRVAPVEPAPRLGVIGMTRPGIA